MMFLKSVPLCLIVLVFSSSTDSTQHLIKIPEPEQTKSEGSCVTISCTYDQGHDENLKLFWFKNPEYDYDMKIYNGTIVYSNTDDRPQSAGYSSRVEYITDKTENPTNSWMKCDLKINDLQKTDSGYYSFRVIGLDNFKYMSTPMSLTVTDNPCKVKIDSSEIKYSVKESDEFTVRCSTSVSCSSHPEWILHKPGQEPERVTSSNNRFTQDKEENEDKKITRLKYNTTWEDDNMILSCHPEESQDSCLTRNVTLSVEYAPKEVKATVSSDNVKEGDSVTLSCTSRGRPDATISWFKQGKEISQLAEWRLVNVKPEDSGEYYCKAENMHGNVESNKISINVKYGPKEVSVTPPVYINDLREGDELKLKCSVGDSNPAVNQFKWFRDNSLLWHQTSQTLTISRVKPEDKGSYYCKAGNGIKTAQSKRLYVSVKYSPRQIQIEGERSVKVGSRLHLTCTADANPPPSSYTWKHKPKVISPLTFPITSSVLYIHSVTVQHSGTYTCDVTNAIGTKAESIDVDVDYPPNINIFNNVTTKKNWEHPVYLICSADAHLPHKDLKCYGLENKTILSHHQNFTVLPQNPGMYYCTATNDVGTSKSEPITSVHGFYTLDFSVMMSFLTGMAISAVIFSTVLCYFPKMCNI